MRRVCVLDAAAARGLVFSRVFFALPSETRGSRGAQTCAPCSRPTPPTRSSSRSSAPTRCARRRAARPRAPKNKPRADPARILRRDAFALVSRAEVAAAKPAPDGLLECCAAIGVEPAACAYVGDAPTDGEAARAAGMRAIGVSWGAHAREKVAPAFDVVCDDVPELRAALGL